MNDLIPLDGARNLALDRPRLRCVGVAEFLILDLPPRELILSPWLPTQGIALLYAARGVGKTFVGLGIAYAVASGGNFLNWTTSTPRRVLYIDGEMPAATMQARIAAIVQSTEKEPPDPDYFRLITPDLQKTGIPDLATKDGQLMIEDHLANVDLVIIDNLSTLVRSGKENEAESWLPVQDWALRLRRRGISVLFIHHAGKGGQQRGTSRREDVLDTVISLKRPADYVATQGARFEVHFEKSRGFAGDDAKPFEAMLQMEGGQAEWTVTDLEKRTFDLVAELLNEGLSQKEVALELGVNKSTVSRHAKRARELGLSVIDGGKGKVE